ncbi:MAG: hypothetical protein NTX59_13905 [Elusimicrobia bacterium]|nr:hypothetical protein [Elusimicrobiota bacterium]
MNLHNDDEKKDGLPPIMGSAFKKTASFGKTTGFSRTAGSIMDKLKNLSRKDMAFVGIGLSILVMAPVAEYLMSKPASDGLLTPGFGGREKGSASGLYEPGINGLSQGSTDGSGEVITPLSSRDPMSLILGSQSSTPPPITSPAPNVSMRDAMKDAGRMGFSEAAKSAGAPTPIPRLQSALRSFGSFFSGGESSRTSGALNGDKIIQDAKNASSKTTSRSMLGPVAMAGYKGVASNTPNSSSRSAFEKLRSQADKSAGNFTGGSAMNSLDRAAADAIDIGKGAGGMGGGGTSDATKGTSNSTVKDSNSHGTECQSLECKANEERQKNQLAWEEYLKHGIKKEIVEAMVQNLVIDGLIKPLGDMMSSNMNSLLGNYPPTQFCWQPFTCPTGDCAAQVAKYNVLGPGDLCQKQYGGATSFKMTAAGGKDSTGGGQIKYCICGEGSKPTTGVPHDGSSVTPPPPQGGGAAPVAPVPPGGPGSTTDNGGTPQQVSDTAAKSFTDYDTVLKDMVNQTGVAEKNSSDAVTVEKSARSVRGGFDNLRDQASRVIEQKLNPAKSDAQAAKSSYSDEVAKAQSLVSKAQENYGKFVGQIAVLQKDVDNNTIRMKTSAASGLGDTKIKAVADTGSEQRKAIVAALAKWKKQGSLGINAAASLYASHRDWLSAYTDQIANVGDGITAIQNKHGDVYTAASNINMDDGKKDWPAKLTQMTGRPISVAPVVADETKKKAASTSGIPTKAPEVPAANNTDKGPSMKQAAYGVRALDWDALWPPGLKFDSSKAAGDEIKAWNAWQSGGGKGDLVKPDNFVSNNMRSNEIKVDITSKIADIKKNIPLGLKDTADIMSLTKGDILGAGADPSYFPENGGGTNPNPIAPVITPPVSGVSDTQRKQAMEAYTNTDGYISGVKNTSRPWESELSGMKKSKLAQGAVSAYRTEMGEIDKRKADIQVKINDPKLTDPKLLETYTASLKNLEQRADKASATLAKAYEDITHKPSNGNTNQINISGAHNNTFIQPLKPPVQPIKPDSKIPAPPRVINSLILYNGPALIRAWDKDGKAILYWACDGKITPKPAWQIGGEIFIGGTYDIVKKMFGKDPRNTSRCSTGWVSKQATVNIEDMNLAPDGMVPPFQSQKLPYVLPYKERIWIGNADANPQVANGMVHYAREQWSAVERGHYKMDVDVTCVYNKAKGFWVFEDGEVRMSHGGGDTVTAYSVEGGISVGIKVVDVSGKVSYTHEQQQFNFGVLTRYPKFNGLQCK